MRFGLIYRISSYWELSYFLIGEIWFDLQDMGSLGCPRYRPLGRMNWAPILGLCQEPGRFTGPTYKSSFNPASWAWGVGLRAYFFKPNHVEY